MDGKEILEADEKGQGPTAPEVPRSCASNCSYLRNFGGEPGQ